MIKNIKKIGVGIVGGIVLLVGIIAIPYPGPGWLIVFAGLAILSTEFTWAGRALKFARSKYDAWSNWLKRQHMVLRMVVLCLTGVIVLLTLWLVNALGMVNDFFNLPLDWIRSPFVR